MTFFRKLKDFILGEVRTCMGRGYDPTTPLSVPPTQPCTRPSSRACTAAQDLVTDGEGRHDQRASASQTDSQPQSSPSQSAPRHEAKAATQAQATAARQPAPPPLLQDGHPVTGGGIQARGCWLKAGHRGCAPSSYNRLLPVPGPQP